jgi:hypothetical protein
MRFPYTPPQAPTSTHLSALCLRAQHYNQEPVGASLGQQLSPPRLFPQLRTLAFQYGHPRYILDVGHAHLETLRIAPGVHYHEEPPSDDWTSDTSFIADWEDPMSHRNGVGFG